MCTENLSNKAFHFFFFFPDIYVILVGVWFLYGAWAARLAGGVGVEGRPLVSHVGSTDVRTRCYRWPVIKGEKVCSKPNTISVSISIDGKIAYLF